MTPTMIFIAIMFILGIVSMGAMLCVVYYELKKDIEAARVIADYESAGVDEFEPEE